LSGGYRCFVPLISFSSAWAGTDDQRQPVACDRLLNEVIGVDAAYEAS
jgi:hypothetical protein